MGSITIRDLDDALQQQLHLRAARAGRSPEDEAHEILRDAIGAAPEPAEAPDLGRRIHARFAALGGADLPEVPRLSARDLPSPD